MLDTNENCVNTTDTTLTTTTLIMSLPINSVDTVLSRRLIECSNQFTIQSDVDLTNDIMLSGALNADSATMKLLQSGW